MISSQHLVESVLAGRLTPAEAEAEAVQLGVSPLAQKPNPEAFDPSREAWWTLPMAVAWIAHRTFDTVRDCWPQYRQHCTHWLYRDAWKAGRASGFRLVPFEPASIAFLEIAEQQEDQTARDADFSLPVLDAAGSLTIALRDHCFAATGINAASGSRESIPSSWWINRSIADLGDQTDFPDAPLGSTSFRDILVPQRAIRTMWTTRQDATRTAQLPPVMPPKGGGYMPLYCAAQWIATEGGTIDFDGHDLDRWRPAYEQLLARIASDEVAVIGFRNGGNEPVPGYHFAGIKVDYPFSEAPLDIILSDDLHLQSYPFIDDAKWRDGFDDSLRRHRGEAWVRLLVRKADIITLWPFGHGQESQTAESMLYRTGAPGRPSAMHLVEAEFQRRCDAGQTAASLASESEKLAAWLKETYPEMPPPTTKTIMNRIRNRYREQKSAR